MLGWDVRNEYPRGARVHVYIPKHRDSSAFRSGWVEGSRWCAGLLCKVGNAWRADGGGGGGHTWRFWSGPICFWAVEIDYDLFGFAPYVSFECLSDSCSGTPPGVLRSTSFFVPPCVLGTKKRGRSSFLQSAFFLAFRLFFIFVFFIRVCLCVRSTSFCFLFGSIYALYFVSGVVVLLFGF